MRPTTCPSTPLPLSVLQSHSCQPHHTTTSPPKWWWHWQWVWPDTCRPWWSGWTAWTTWTTGTSRYCNWPLVLLLRAMHKYPSYSVQLSTSNCTARVGQGISGHPSPLPNLIDVLSKLRNNVLPNVHYFHYCVSTSTQMNLTQSGCLFLWETSHFSMLVKNLKFCC